MCGRFTASFQFREIKIHWNLQGPPDAETRFDISVLTSGRRTVDKRVRINGKHHVRNYYGVCGP